MRDAHFYANEGFKKINSTEFRNAYIEYAWHKNDYHCVTTGSHLVRFNLTSSIEMQHISYQMKKKVQGRRERRTECSIMDGRKVTRV